MGFEVREAPPAEEKQRATEQRQAILDDLAAGRINSTEAIQQLRQGS
jgi:CheY-like chemotaxis protein